MNFEHLRHTIRGWLYHFLGQEEKSFAEYTEAYRYAPGASEARNLGFLATSLKRPDVGAFWFSEAAKLSPQHAETWFNLGFARERLGQKPEAIEAFSEAIRLNPALDRAWFGKGLAHAALGEHGDAAEAFEEAARLQPLNGEAWYNVGMAQHHAGNPERVTEVVRKLRSFEPKRSNQLIADTGRTELAELRTELPF